MSPRQNNDALFSAAAILAALKSSTRVLGWLMAALGVIYLGSGIKMIGPNENGLLLRFGKMVGRPHPPGLLFALPEPIDEVILVPVRSVQERILEEWESRAIVGSDWSLTTLNPVRDHYTLTGDTNIIRARFSVRYQVADAVAYAFAAHDRELLLDSILYEAATRTLAAMCVDDALTTRRDFVSQETMRFAQAEIDRLRLGIQLLAFETRELNPPTQVMQSFQDVVSAKVEAKTLIEPANSYRASVIPQAAAEAYRMQQESGAYAKQLITKAQGEVFSFLALLKEYNANPLVIRARLYAEMLETVVPKMRISTILPSSTDELRLVLSPQITFSRVGEEQSPAPASVNTLPLQTEPVYDDK